MCGIAGLIHTPARDVGADRIDRISQLLRHRGPDDRGFAAYDGRGVVSGREPSGTYSAEVLLIHRRLTILDCTTAAWQPLSDAAGTCYLTFNGEIYNYVELRDELTALGHRFVSSGDTEVLLKALMEWGPGALTRLVGMFAFALLDTTRRSVLLARDPFGIKPLYYARCGDGIAFASEIAALLAQPGVGRTVNAQRLYDYLRFNYTDHGPDTMLADVHQIPPAHYAMIDLDGAAGIGTPRCYWHLPARADREIGFDEAAAEVRDAFLDNVRLHLRSDVPVGATLSGGIDSASVVMGMRAAAPSMAVRTFSYVADDQPYSEEKWIDMVATACEAESHKLRLTPADLRRDLPALIRAQGEPFGDVGVYAEFCLFRRAREAAVKVMLSGHGADEVLGGYRQYYGARLASLVRAGAWGRAIALWRHIAHHSGGGFHVLASAADHLLPAEFRTLGRRVMGRDMVPGWMDGDWFRDRGVTDPLAPRGREEHVLARELRHSVVHGLPHHLRYEDRSAMAHSIENRVPFLTPKLVSLLLSLPESYTIDAEGRTKAVFRAAMRGIVPPEVLERRDKIGFEAPQDEWLATSPEYVSGLLESDATRDIRPFKRDVMMAYWRKVGTNGATMDSLTVWRWLSTIEWTEHIDASYD